MKKWKLLSLALVCSWTLTAEAQQSTECAPEVPAAERRALLEHETRPGIWFDIRVARCMLSQLETLPRYIERVQLLEQRLSITDDRHALMERQVNLAEDGEEHAVSALEAAVRGRRQAEESLNFERSLRWLWFGIGVVLVVALEALAVWAINEVAP